MHTVSRPSVRGLRELGSGCYATVYASRDGDYAIKKARNDGTRSYLEWVLKRTLEGKRLRGMPWVESVVDNGPGRYIAVMRRYAPLDAVAPAVSRSCTWDGVERHPDTPKYVAATVCAFTKETGCRAIDLHSANVMSDDNGEWIVTDPAAGAYLPITVH